VDCGHYRELYEQFIPSRCRRRYGTRPGTGRGRRTGSPAVCAESGIS
jgi:hypothetical protein